MLAIVIPYYKINFFEECLQSLANQTSKNFRVYIGDDASPDDPSGIVSEYNKQLTLKIKRFKENLGGKSLT
ncbi:glycosyltransferase family 2 protein [Antarcticibacterium sp. 1MA-6-2]|uniref:glycosyltransferase family A protein n=1 Tax=Antarcticibacterium sp. 1MA-6-2 TaxID=2908210 RepID=UPI001F1B9B57|nr:glycosyltransferase family A protein [Antarcticibacterium sp. 1MA-6-2]UJH92516.1 glycosyltransferase family 2 protein [Antarcticibacterium sp. 1MA-6-2]